MNETFMKARAMFERMMEESLALHTGGIELNVHRDIHLTLGDSL
jgi:hypothetical protein